MSAAHDWPDLPPCLVVTHEMQAERMKAWKGRRCTDARTGKPERRRDPNLPADIGPEGRKLLREIEAEKKRKRDARLAELRARRR